MSDRYLQILLFITIFGIHTIKSDDTVDALKKILKELNAPNEDRYHSRALHHPHHYKHGKSKHGSDSPNLMNVQTMNLFLKPNKRQRVETEVDMQRTNAEICDATGRCGCTGTRCGTNKEDELADEVDRVVNEINEQLANDDGNRDVDDQRDDDEDEDRHREMDEDDTQRGMDDEDVDKKNKEDSDHDEINLERNDEDDDDLEEFDDLFKSKTIQVNDNLDVVILDKSDLENLLRHQNFIDLTRIDGDKDDKEKVLVELKKPVAAERNSVYRSGAVITPEDFFGLYEIFKRQVVKNITKYVKSKRQVTSLKMKYLTRQHKKRLRSLRNKYRRGDIELNALEVLIIHIIFGEHSKLKIVPHNNRNDNIYVPMWLYDMMLDDRRLLRTQKRVLPLTFQQKERWFNKEKVKTIPKLVWRKNSDHDVQRFGIPFDFEVHGLGQVAP